MTAPVASDWSVRRVGLPPTRKRRILTADARRGSFGRRPLGLLCLPAEIARLAELLRLQRGLISPTRRSETATKLTAPPIAISATRRMPTSD